MVQLRFSSAVMLAIGAATFGCQANVFHTEVKGETTIQGSPLGGILGAFPTAANFTNLDFDANQDFKNQGVHKNQVNSVKAESIKLKVVSPSDQDFRFLDQLQFFAKSGDTETLVGEKLGISDLDLSAPNPVLSLEMKDAELKDHVSAPSMSIIVRGKGRPPPQDTRIEAAVNLRVEIKLF